MPRTNIFPVSKLHKLSNGPRRTKKIIYDQSNVVAGAAARVFGNSNKPIRKQKIVETPRKTKIVDYGPVNYYGKQTKTKTIIRKK